MQQSDSSRLSAVQKAAVSASRAHAQALRACRAAGMSMDVAAASARRAVANLAEARRRRGLARAAANLTEARRRRGLTRSAAKLAEARRRRGLARAAANLVEARRRLAARRLSQQANEADATAATAIAITPPPSPPPSPPPGSPSCVESGIGEESSTCISSSSSEVQVTHRPRPRATCAVDVQERVRREYLDLAPYIDRIESLASLHAALRTARQKVAPLPPSVAFEFVSPPVNEAGETFGLVFDDDREAYVQLTNAGGHGMIVSDVYSLDALEDVVSLARLLRSLPGVFDAMQLEAIVLSNVRESPDECFFASKSVRTYR